MRDYETRIRKLFQNRWSDPKNIHREDDNLALGWHFGYYEKGFRTYKKAIINMNNYIDRLLEINDNNFRILDAGCGVGATTTHLAKKNPNSNFFGITLSSNEVILAEKLKSKNNLKNTYFYQKSYNSTNFLDEYFNGIYALESVCYAINKTVFLKEMNRILKHNGKLIIIDAFAQNDLTSQFCKNIRRRFLGEKNFKNAVLTIDKFKEKLIDGGFGNIIICDLIKSRNVKFSFFSFFIFHSSFRNFLHNTLKQIRQKSHKPLFFRWCFFYHFLFDYLLVVLSRYSYFSIVSIKKANNLSILNFIKKI